MHRDRAFRIHHVERVIRNRIRFIKRCDPTHPTIMVGERIHGRYPHGLADRKPYDCGRSDCQVCGKFGRKEARQRILRDRVVEGLDEAA